jgi:hypothetical protein
MSRQSPCWAVQEGGVKRREKGGGKEGEVGLRTKVDSEKYIDNDIRLGSGRESKIVKSQGGP